jgi:hypothetical protein
MPKTSVAPLRVAYAASRIGSAATGSRERALIGFHTNRQPPGDGLDKKPFVDRFS